MSTDTKPADAKPADRNIGRNVIRHDGMAGEIEARAGSHYVIRWTDGSDSTIAAADYEAADKAHLAELSRRAGMKPTGAVREDARQALDRLDASRRAVSQLTDIEKAMIFKNATRPRDLNAPMTADERARILQRVAEGSTKLTAAEAAKIQARLDGKGANAAPDFKASVQAHMARLAASGRRDYD